jgi:hypothetical protein
MNKNPIITIEKDLYNDYVLYVNFHDSVGRRHVFTSSDREIINNHIDGVFEDWNEYFEIIDKTGETDKKLVDRSIISQEEVDNMSLGLDDNGWEK